MKKNISLDDVAQLTLGWKECPDRVLKQVVDKVNDLLKPKKLKVFAYIDPTVAPGSDTSHVLALQKIDRKALKELCNEGWGNS